MPICDTRGGILLEKYMPNLILQKWVSVADTSLNLLMEFSPIKGMIVHASRIKKQPENPYGDRCSHMLQMPQSYLTPRCC